MLGKEPSTLIFFLFISILEVPMPQHISIHVATVWDHTHKNNQTEQKVHFNFPLICSLKSVTFCRRYCHLQRVCCAKASIILSKYEKSGSSHNETDVRQPQAHTRFQQLDIFKYKGQHFVAVLEVCPCFRWKLIHVSVSAVSYFPL